MNRNAISAATVVALVLVTALIGHSQETTAERVARIEAMSAADKSELRLKLERFEKLSTDERKRRTALNEALNEHPDGEQLREVMHRYYDWLKTISSVERLKLQELPPEERITEIKRIIASQERKQFEEFTRYAFRDIQPKREDFQAIKIWFDQWRDAHKEEILANEQQIYDKVPWLKERLEDAADDRKLFVIWAWLMRDPEMKAIMPSDKDFQQLSSQLDKETQQRLQAETPDRQRGLLSALMQAAVFAHFQNRVDDDQLQKFYRKLPEKRQAELAALPPERFDAELRHEYMRANGGRFFGGRPPGPPWDRDRDERDGRDGRRGDGRGPDDRDPEGRGPEGRGDRGPGGPPGMRGDRERGPRPPEFDGPPPPMRDGPPRPRQEESPAPSDEV
ncbi:hypothetical protein Pan97_51670 [Bremerella volcania]|uniref:DUF3106 domain-containing protein n=1 Tax=Bremerella volcania TaxID=2527984 RepID=A0A518CFV4_9BACT|nr:hypothetical protein [Bremerella volcania]QDU78087.1 hypothetical protein Pan97_51670 [Bremerella volcania]